MFWYNKLLFLNLIGFKFECEIRKEYNWITITKKIDLLKEIGIFKNISELIKESVYEQSTNN